jgi:hypothetical protein
MSPQLFKAASSFLLWRYMHLGVLKQYFNIAVYPMRKRLAIEITALLRHDITFLEVKKRCLTFGAERAKP